MNKAIRYLVIIAVIITLIVITGGCLKPITPAQKAKTIVKEKTDNQEEKELDDLEMQEKLELKQQEESSEETYFKNKLENAKNIYPLGKAQKSEIWQYLPSKIKRTSTITNDLGVVHSAGAGKEYVLIHLKMTNIDDMIQNPLISYDPEPMLAANNKQYEYEDTQIANLPEKDQFIEGRDLKKNQSTSGWLIFKIPKGAGNLKLIIEDLVWKA